MISTPETIKTLNERLLHTYGRFEDKPKFRIVWSTDEFETRAIRETPEGLTLLNPIIKTVPKYNYARNRYILEKITAVPIEFIEDIGAKLSYEPLWVFETNTGEALPPVWEAIELIFEALETALRPKAPYRQPEEEGNTTEAIEHKVDVLQKQLYGDDTEISDGLATGSAVGFGSKRRQVHTDLSNNPLRGKF